MFNINNYQPLIHYLKSYSRIWKPTSGGKWIQMFCPYCDDAVRKANPNHGHCYIAAEYPYFICFRCNENGSLIKLLHEIGFTNQNILNEISKFAVSNIKYKLRPKIRAKEFDYYQYNLEQHLNFAVQDQEKYQLILNYIETRMLHINPIRFGVIPYINNNNIGIEFINYYGNVCGNRLINSNLRYYNDDKDYYYFQDILSIINHKHIIICEGQLDLINLFNYSRFNNLPSEPFYISVGGSFYHKLIRYLISNYLTIGSYQFHIVLDNFNKFERQNLELINKTVERLNHFINVNFYRPVAGKDVSDCSLLVEV